MNMQSMHICRKRKQIFIVEKSTLAVVVHNFRYFRRHHLLKQ